MINPRGTDVGRGNELARLMDQAGQGALTRADFMKRAAALGVASSGMATLLAACGSGSETATTGGASTTASNASGVTIPGPPWQGGQRGGAGKIGWIDDTANFDPATSYDQPGFYGTSSFYRGLTFFNERNENALDLAESMDVSDDARSFRFTLKRGVMFQHGRELTADDVKYTLERIADPRTGSWAASMLSAVTGYEKFTRSRAPGLAGVKAPSRYVVEIRLDRPNVTIPQVMGVQTFFIVPQDEVKRLGRRFATNPVGTGPFKLDNFDVAGRRLQASRFDDYIYADQLPYVDSLEVEWGVTLQLQYLRTQRGELSHTTQLDPSLVAQLQKTAPDQLQKWQTVAPFFIMFDLSKPPFDDVRVRQAFNHAYDRERMRASLFDPTGHWIPPTLPGYDDGLQVYEYDPEKARALLKQAGYDGDLTVDFPLFRNNEDTNSGQILQQNLKDIGVTLNLKRDPALIWDIGTKLPDKYRLWRIGYGPGLPDTSEQVAQFLLPDGFNNYSRYDDARVNRLAKQGLGEVDPAKRSEIYAEIEKILMEDAVFLFESVQVAASYKQATLENYVWEPTYRLHWDRYWFDNA